MTTLFDGHKTAGLRRRENAIRHYVSNGVDKLLIQYATERLTQAEQVERLNALGLTTFFGRPFSQAMLSRIIRSLQASGILPS